MKILAVNGSPLRGKGATALILNPFLEGAEAAGAQVELIELDKMNIKPCRGDLICWGKTPGRCHLKDDMGQLLPKIDQADILVYASPVYIDTMTAQMKTFFDRHVPLMEPEVVFVDGHCRHPRRVKKKQKMVVVSVCGFYEMDNFDILIRTVEAMTKNFGVEYVGAVLRPYATFLKSEKIPDKVKQSIYSATRQAGRQIVEQGSFREETLAEIAKPLMPLDTYVNVINHYWRNVKEGKAPPEAS